MQIGKSHCCEATEQTDVANAGGEAGWSLEPACVPHAFR